MRYLLPFVVLLAVVAGALPSRADEIQIYGPFLDDQMEQMRQAAIYERLLKKDQQEQADQSALYAKELSKDQKAQAQQAAIYQTELAKDQKAQAEKSAEYSAELSKDQKAQAAASAEYALKLKAHDDEWRAERYKLRARQQAQMDALGGKMFDESRLGAPAPTPAAATGAEAAVPAAPTTPEGTTQPADNNALKDQKKDLMKALQDIDEGK
jgi:hypothetical protein